MGETDVDRDQAGNDSGEIVAAAPALENQFEQRALRIQRAKGIYRIQQPTTKLIARARLPGAYGYDQAAHGYRIARASGVPLQELLPCAIPGSWMVNSKAPSTVFQRWLSSPLREIWADLLDLLAEGPEVWLASSTEVRRRVEAHILDLSIAGQGICAISKVLALLLPETVPLMDDAALSFAIDAIPMPDSPDTPKATAELFCPMLDWFTEQVVENWDELVVLARDHNLAVLDAAQVLDRLLWVESYGHKVLRLDVNRV